MKKIRTLSASEIEVRVADKSKTTGKIHMLLYIDSRAATTILDETYGMANWNLEYRDVAGQIYGRLTIFDEDTGRWVYREDTGSESNIEAQKGLSSDILKRLIVRFGVTELYTAPKIYLEDDGYGNTGYKVGTIKYDKNRKITFLTITDRFNNVKYTFGYNNVDNEVKRVEMFDDEVTVDADLLYNDAEPFIPKPTPKPKPTKTNSEILIDFCAKQKTVPNTDIDDLVRFYNFYNKKIGTWENTFNPIPLYKKWCQTKKSA